MTFEDFNSQDIREITYLLKDAYPREIISEEIIQKKIFDDLDFNPSLAIKAVSNGKIIGFILGVVRNYSGVKYGFIKLLAVEKAYRRKKIARGLLDIVIKEMRAENIKNLGVFDSRPNYFTPGVDPYYTDVICFLESVGFEKKGECVSLECEITKEKFDSRDEEIKLHKEGVKIFRPQFEKFEEIKSWTEENFPQYIAEVSSAFLNKPISIRFVEKNGMKSGFAVYDVIDENIGLFGPMEIVKDLEETEIQKVLLKIIMRDLQQMGLKKVIINCVDNICFYAKNMNARLTRIFWRYEKLL